jgi:hypothetical protein
MPKALAIFAAALALAVALADCGGTTSSNPTPAPTTSFTPDPSITAATVAVTGDQGSPAPYIPVEISTPASTSSPRPGTPFLTQKTGIKGMTKFNHLKPSNWYCWVAIFNTRVTASNCSNWTTWQFDTITLSNNSN